MTASPSSTTTAPAVVVEEPYVPNYVKSSLPSPWPDFPGLPLYIITDARDVLEIDKTEGAVYYVLACAEIKSTSSNNVTTTTIQPGLYKRVRILSGNGLVAVTSAEGLGFGKVAERAYFNLPAMPEGFINKIDHFFRKVDEKHGTEAIVMLGYYSDMLGTDNEADGWTVLVPTQTNTAGNCKYTPESVMAEKPDDVTLVGTVHSHPGMSAFASHTDVGDQYNNDGLHITIGWKGKSGAPEYHIEYQMGNRRFSFDPEDVFDFAPKAEYEVDDWVSKVSKQNYGYGGNYKSPTQAGTSTSGQNKTGSTTTTGGPSQATDLGSRLHGEFFRDRHNKSRPGGSKACPDLLKNIVVAVVPAAAEKCPTCGKPFDNFSDRNRRCTDCFTYLLLAEDDGDLNKIIEARTSAYQGKVYAPGLEFLFEENPASITPVLVWDPTAEDGHIKCVWSPKSGVTQAGKAHGVKVA